MCGRGSLTKIEKELEDRFQATFYSEDIEQYNPLPNYNVAPTQFHPVITNQDPHRLQLFKWGLIPSWAKEQKIGSQLINARIETITSKPAFRNAIRKQRCIVPFDGFYEWKKSGKNKIPFRITRPDQKLFAIAGIWDSWKDENGNMVHSFSLITQEPNLFMSSIHNRMPAILLPEQESLWLDNEIPVDDLLKMISPPSEDYLKAYKVSTKVNSVRNNSIDLLTESKEDINPQGTLF